MRSRMASAAAALLVVVGACGAQGDAGVASVDSPPADARPEVDLAILDAGSLEATDVVVWFWAEW